MKNLKAEKFTRQGAVGVVILTTEDWVYCLAIFDKNGEIWGYHPDLLKILDVTYEDIKKIVENTLAD